MKFVTVIGNRPQFVKAAAVSRLLRAEHEEVLVHTGQHYDDELSAVFFAELGHPAARPRAAAWARARNAEQTARMLAALGALLGELAPDVVLVYGDTNSTLAGGAGRRAGGIPVAHVEAGMRSFDRADARGAQPRADRPPLVAAAVPVRRSRPTTSQREGVAAPVELVGDVMVDIAAVRRSARGPTRRAGAAA